MKVVVDVYDYDNITLNGDEFVDQFLLTSPTGLVTIPGMYGRSVKRAFIMLASSITLPSRGGKPRTTGPVSSLFYSHYSPPCRGTITLSLTVSCSQDYYGHSNACQRMFWAYTLQ